MATTQALLAALLAKRGQDYFDEFDAYHTQLLETVGGAVVGARLVFSTTIADADPGAGIIRFNHATLASVTQLFVDLAEAGGADITALLARLFASTSGDKALVTISAVADNASWVMFTVTAGASPAGYRKLTVTHLATASGFTGFADAAEVFLAGIPVGDQGDSGAADLGGLIPGANITASVTLTAGAANLRALVMTAAYQSVTLPDATTLDEGFPFSFPNIGSYSVTIRASGGTGLRSVAPGGGITLTLLDNASAAGVWAIEGILISHLWVRKITAIAGNYSVVAAGVCEIAANKFLILLNNNSTHLYVVIYDAATDTMGTVTAIETSGSVTMNACAGKVADSLYLVAYTVGGVATAKAISVSGTTPTVGVAVDINSPYTLGIAPSSTSWLLIRGLANKVAGKVLTISGTTITEGAEQDVYDFGSGNGFVRHALLRATNQIIVDCYGDAPGARAVHLTISAGTTITADSSVSLAAAFTATSTVMDMINLTTDTFLIGGLNAAGTAIAGAQLSVSGVTLSLGTAATIMTGITAGFVSLNGTGASRAAIVRGLVRTSATTALVYSQAASNLATALVTNNAGTITATERVSTATLNTPILVSVDDTNGKFGCIIPISLTQDDQQVSIVTVLSSDGSAPYFQNAQTVVTTRNPGQFFFLGDSLLVGGDANSVVPVTLLKGDSGSMLQEYGKVVLTDTSSAMRFYSIPNTAGTMLGHVGKQPGLLASGAARAAQLTILERAA